MIQEYMMTSKQFVTSNMNCILIIFLKKFKAKKEWLFSFIFPKKIKINK
jgi:hypothetical protein